ncbi:MAG: GIY-YIG nuclease family protein [Gammaproteobacteria bacterium]|jgi:excinuclease UvrABC nuclease subunit|nr:GIY-YIG nuclease family protein [Gammaproteobacteria bacterium]MBT4330512.1 GIY-YIG nuclease family protein [Gammaproteobacteria bacterium]
MPFSRLGEILESSPGVYEISQQRQVCYPGGYSSVVYIGQSRKLRKRFQTYLSGKAHSERLSLLMQQPQLLTVRVAYTDEQAALESRMIHTFEHQFGAIPCGNQKRPLIRRY